jgi:hypothetical protein
MLQGFNRLDRFKKYISYLRHLFGYTHIAESVVQYDYVNNVSHDPVQMLLSHKAHCAIFGFCT